ncbi:hypothetical protein T484DRAFT_1777114 [Baffinella frigidus]|nr:hypothetical protein T484DRAFT_1777114 [Cryptophyta sp. CCMP2293]
MGGGASSQGIPEEDVQWLTQETYFTPQQIKRLYKRFNVIDAASVGFMTRRLPLPHPPARRPIVLSSYGHEKC